MRTLPDTTDHYGELYVTPIGHASLYIEYKGECIAVDPYSEVADFSTLPEATAILLTHDHYDHYDPDAIRAIATPRTTFIAPPIVADLLRRDGFTQPVITLSNGEAAEYGGTIRIEAVEAYNLVRERAPGQPFHPKGAGNGYILTLDGKRIYIAGDTEDTPEVLALHDIDAAFLPVNQPYTMTVDQAVRVVKAIRPRIFYPYHYGEVEEKTDIDRLKRELEGVTDVRVFPME